MKVSYASKLYIIAFGTLALVLIIFFFFLDPTKEDIEELMSAKFYLKGFLYSIPTIILIFVLYNIGRTKSSE